MSHPAHSLDAVTPRCPDCNAEFEPADQHDDHTSPAGAPFLCRSCGTRWVRDATGLLIDAD